MLLELEMLLPSYPLTFLIHETLDFAKVPEEIIIKKQNLFPHQYKLLSSELPFWGAFLCHETCKAG